MAKNNAATEFIAYTTSPTGGLVAAGVLFATSAVTATIAICYGLLPYLLGATPLATLYIAILGGTALLLATAAIAFMLPSIHENNVISAEVSEPDRSAKLYGRYLVGVGFAMLIGAIACSAILASLTSFAGKRLPTAVDPSLQGDEFDATRADEAAATAADAAARIGNIFGQSSDETAFVIVLLFLSTMVALLGALFFFATSLWQRVKIPDQEPFDRNLFWAGLWHRLGTAVILNIVLFFFLRYYAPENFFILPLAALLVGMFLKSGEKLIAGLAERFFAAFDALIPPRIPKPEAVPRVLSLGVSTLFENNTLISVGKTFVQSLESLKGVSRVVIDPVKNEIRIEFDVNKTSRERILHEARLQGVTID